MNLKIFTVGLLSAFFSISCLYAAGSSAAQSKTDMKAEFKTRVTKNDFGDIFISKLPELPDKSKIKDLNVIGTTMLVFISYVDNELDFDKLNDSMAKSSGAIDKKGNRKSSVPIDGLISGANKYLSSKNMGLQKVGYTPTTSARGLKTAFQSYAGLRFRTYMKAISQTGWRKERRQNRPMIGLRLSESLKRKE